jgi:hypothetical protein
MTAPVPEPADSRARPLTDSEHAAVLAVAAATAGFALLGFANSFVAVSRAAEPSFGGLAPTVPLGIDLGIAIFAALDIVLARLGMRPKWVRLVPWALTAATIYLNTAGQHAWFGRIAHAVFPALWVMAVEAGAHVIRVRAALQSATAMDRIRPSRWLLAPLTTAALWRRMVLWEIRSYPAALARERARVLARTELADTYGWRWRQTAPRRTRALYRLGELSPAATGRQATAEAHGEAPDIRTETSAVRDAIRTEITAVRAAADRAADLADSSWRALALLRAEIGAVRPALPATTPEPVPGSPEVDRDALVAELADQIRDAISSGEKWTPDYDALMRRTGYRRSWCEKAVRDARTQAFSAPCHPGSRTDPSPYADPARTDGPHLRPVRTGDAPASQPPTEAA